ncbi:Mur ligase domain-containing protein, partial [Pseudomonas protegens]|uniref:Mur ligase domain-containing protein n=1 Tax=Pseudomonas protegens TaxID=380021 RepID=UPI001FF0C6D3
MSLSLNKIFAHAGRDLLIRELTLDSRNVRAGDLFLAVPGAKFDGRAHIADALQRGAAAVAYEVEGATVLPLTDVPLIPVKGLSAQLSDIAGRFYGDPSRQLGNAGLAVGAGHAHQIQLAARVTIEAPSYVRQLRRQALDRNQRYIGQRQHSCPFHFISHPGQPADHAAGQRRIRHPCTSQWRARLMSLSLNKIFAHAGRDLLIRELTLDSRNVRA